MLNEAQMMSALAARHKAPEWAFLPQVADGTGLNKVRTADALAMSLWPSRGIYLNGFEVKVSRADWLRELANPAKAESVCQFCDFWWIVAGDPNIVVDGELPPTWGLLVPKGKGLRVATAAPKLTPKPICRSFLAALLRKAAEYVAPKWVEPVRQLEQDEWQAAFDKGAKQAERNAEYRIDGLQEKLAEQAKAIEDFETASGVRIERWSAGRVGEAVAVLVDLQRRRDAAEDLQRRLKFAEREVKHLREQVAIFADGESAPLETVFSGDERC